MGTSSLLDFGILGRISTAPAPALPALLWLIGPHFLVLAPQALQQPAWRKGKRSRF